MTTRGKIILGVSTAVAAALVAVPLLYAHGGGDGHCRFGGFGKMAAMARQLELTSQQRDALHRIHDATRAANAQAKQQLHDGIMDAAKILIADPQNVGAARAALEAQQAAFEQLKGNALKGVAEGLSVLTPEQRAQLAIHLEEHGRRLAR